MDVNTKLIVKWCGSEFDIDITENDTIQDLKHEIQRCTGVRPERQKLLNLRLKGKQPEDDCRISQMKLKPGFKIMMIGTLEKDIDEVNSSPPDLPEVINDLDIENEEIAIENQDVYLAKVEKRINTYDIQLLNELRPDKKLLVLDIDYTLYDNRSAAESGAELMRPYLHEFLTDVYPYYDISIWSATGMKWIEKKMEVLGVSTNPNYKIAFYLDSLAMISVHIPKYGIMNVKPLGVIWGKFPQFSSKNTIMFDDIRRNFIMNPKNGLRIKPYRNAHINRYTDDELLRLAKYLVNLAENSNDFATVNHRHWEKYKPKKRRDGNHQQNN